MTEIRARLDKFGVGFAAIILLVLSLSLGLIGHLQAYGTLNLSGLLQDFYANASAEFASIAITVLIIDTLSRRRESQAEIRQVKQQLIRQLGSGVNNDSRRAAEELAAHGWLEDGSLQGANLRKANLQYARLRDSDLRRADLTFANISRAGLNGAKLQGAHLRSANMHGSWLIGAKLVDADLHEAKMQRTKMRQADLYRANLLGANLDSAELMATNLQDADLENAQLSGVTFDRQTILPDGETWTAETDMARFTDSGHPDFWRSADPQSPAYAEDDDGIDKFPTPESRQNP